MQLADSISNVKGIGPQREAVLRAAGINQVRDLLTYLPYTYEDSSQIYSVEQAQEFLQTQPEWKSTVVKIAVRAKAEKISLIRTKRGLVLVTGSFVDEENGNRMKVVWFNQPYVQREITEGVTYILYGRIKREGSQLQLIAPKFEEFIKGEPLKKLGRISPLYRRIRSLTSSYISSFVARVVTQVELTDPVPLSILREHTLPSLHNALATLHSPQKITDIALAKRRVAIHELHQLKESYEKNTITQPLKKNEASRQLARECAKLFGTWIPKLRFTLTDSQNEVLNNLLQQIEQGELDTLVYGDVGSGKTIIAHLFSFAFAKLGYISVVVAPTVILAQQHEAVAKDLSQAIGEPEILLAFVSGKRKTFAEDKAQVVIGTQAILHSENLTNHPLVKFVCIDEQHRFGVQQRKTLQAAGRFTITLSATPIPRSLALSFLNFSSTEILSQKPVGRQEIVSKVVPYGKEEVTYTWIRKRLEKKEQAYLVFPRIFADDGGEKQSLTEMAEYLKSRYFEGYRSSILHGGMKDDEKNQIMEDFRNGTLQLLFSTSVIEVGVDAPGATVIGIHGADLFGLAQLHQLRGRVGRSNAQGYCLLFPSESSENAMERLNYFCAHSKGIDVAEYDLKNRGSGTILGLQQAGNAELRIATLSNVSEIEEAMELYKYYNNQKGSQIRLFQLKSENG